MLSGVFVDLAQDDCQRRAGVDAQVAGDVSDFVSAAAWTVVQLRRRAAAAHKDDCQCDERRIHAGARIRGRGRLDDRNHQLRARTNVAEIQIGVVLAQQPDRNVVALLREHPDRLARLDHVRGGVLDAELREERFLQLAVIFLAPRFELIVRDLGERQFHLAADDDRRRERHLVQAAQVAARARRAIRRSGRAFSAACTITLSSSPTE